MTTHLNGGRASLRIPTAVTTPAAIPAQRPTVTLPPKAKREVVRVHLRNVNQYAVLYRDDYDRVIAELGQARWCLNTFTQRSGRVSRYVRAHSSKTKQFVMIARIIAKAPNRTAVRSVDYDPLNLRSGNLTIDLDRGCGGVKKRPKSAVYTSEARERTKAALAGINVSKGLRIVL